MAERTWIPLLNLHPFSNYQVEEKIKERKDKSADDILALQRAKYDGNGIKITVEAVMLVEQNRLPCVLVMKRKDNGMTELPGGQLEPGEIDTDGLKLKLTKKLAVPKDKPDWQVMECVANWYKSGSNSGFCSYLLKEIAERKECKRIFIVQLPKRMKFGVQKEFELLAVPFSIIEDNSKEWGKVIASIPMQLSSFTLNFVD